MRLETERLILREFTAGDWPVLLAQHQDPRYRAQYPNGYDSEPNLRRLLDMFLAWQQEGPRYRWQLAITLRGSDALIGNCGIRLQAPGAGVAEMGYGLAVEHWRQGYASEAARRMLRFAFEELGVHRVGARVVETNARSLAVLRRLGFVPEGRLREHEHIGDVWHDDLMFGLLRQEWERASL
jgi:RimJ/RimL family protein N-acetyltransferase